VSPADLPWAQARAVVAETAVPSFPDAAAEPSSCRPARTYDGQTGKYPPAFGPFTVTNCSTTKALRVFDVSGLAGDHVKGFVARNCDFNGVSNPSNTFTNVDCVVLSNVKINGRTVTG
jgi:hypothetical protein